VIFTVPQLCQNLFDLSDLAQRRKEAGIRKSLKNRCTLGDAELLEAWAMLQKQARSLIRLPTRFQIEKRISKCYVVDIRLALSCVLEHGFGRFSAPIVPNLFSDFPKPVLRFSLEFAQSLGRKGNSLTEIRRPASKSQSQDNQNRRMAGCSRKRAT
jgi:hypothetical protein